MRMTGTITTFSLSISSCYKQSKISDTRINIPRNLLIRTSGKFCWQANHNILSPILLYHWTQIKQHINWRCHNNVITFQMH